MLGKWNSLGEGGGGGGSHPSTWRSDRSCHSAFTARVMQLTATPAYFQVRCPLLFISTTRGHGNLALCVTEMNMDLQAVWALG